MDALSGFSDLARLDTAGADLHPPVSTTRKLDANGLQIRIKASTSFVISVGNVVTKLGSFPANVAFLCHMIIASDKTSR
jgi:hypothetical protein